MKKYFAKYLPVEGEIKDAFFRPDGNLCIMNEEQKQITTSGMLEVGCNAVKFFLCSKDIQIGDEMTSVLGPIKGKVEHELQRDEAIKGNNWYKVVGEISPKANWVKEGDEFEEENLKKIVYDGVEHHLPLDSSPPAKRIEIECPTCKHFH